MIRAALIAVALLASPAAATDAWHNNYDAAVRMQTARGLTCMNRIFSGPYYSADLRRVCNDGVCYPVERAVHSPGLVAKLWLLCRPDQRRE